ncbi:unnamed protein product [Echinostoma caproni]|uniref:PEHE domain-containing protein n=1 Tax=Echinostoma caproni TaxID=27848 RepID=A0A183A8U4_9TREM|nr:unnamed protein product [Echinostoma caproni]
MEWSGCGIFGKLWRYLLPRRPNLPNEVDDQDCSLSSLGDIERNMNTVLIEEPTQALFEKIVPGLIQQNENIQSEHTRELNHAADMIRPKLIHQRPHSAHIPFRPIVLYEQCSTVEEIHRTPRNRSDDNERPIQPPSRVLTQSTLLIEGAKVHTVACNRFTNISTSTIEMQPGLELETPVDQDSANTSTTNQTNSVQQLTQKLERFNVPKRADEILHAIDDTSITRKMQSKEKDAQFTTRMHHPNHMTRMRHAYPYFMPESAYVKLKQEERWKELRRELRLELETQIDCDVLRRVNRLRRPHQIPVLPAVVEAFDMARLLTVPPSIPTLIRLGIQCKSKMKTSPAFPTVRVFQNSSNTLAVGSVRNRRTNQGTRRLGRRNRICTTNNKQTNPTTRPNTSDNHTITRSQGERPKTAEERRTTAIQMIELYTTASNLIYDYPDHEISIFQLPLWTWRDPYETGEDEEKVNKSSIYKDILEDLLVPIEHRKKKRSVRLCAATGTEEEAFFLQLISLERLQLLTRLEESEVIATNPEEDLFAIRQMRTKHGKYGYGGKKNTWNRRRHNLPPLNTTLARTKDVKSAFGRDVLFTTTRRSKFPSITPYTLGANQYKIGSQTRLSIFSMNNNRSTSKILPISPPETRNPTNSPELNAEFPALINLPSIDPSKPWRESSGTNLLDLPNGYYSRTFSRRTPHKVTQVKWNSVGLKQQQQPQPLRTPTPVVGLQSPPEKKTKSRRRLKRRSQSSVY